MPEFNGITLTTEQENVVKTVIKEENTKISAYAGTGKTFITACISHVYAQKRGIYLCFNKSAAVDAAKRFPNNVDCRTVHSLAYQAIGYKYRDRLERFNGFELMKCFDIGSVQYFKKKKYVKGNFILQTITRFCQTAKAEIDIYCTPYSDIKKFVEEDYVEAAQFDIVKYAKLVWKEMNREGSRMPITHDFYLKKFGMLDPVLDCDFLIIDEAQDSNPITLQIAENQKCQVIYVGDQYQAIYSWRGAIDAMTNIRTPGNTSISQSFRFGPRIAALANEILNSYIPGANTNIKGFEKHDTEIGEVTTPDVIITRTNKGTMEAIMKNLQDRTIYITGGPNPLIKMFEGVLALQAGNKTYHPDLKLFTKWSEVEEFAETKLGSDLKVIVNLVKVHGAQNLIDTLQQTSPRYQEGCLTITSAHKCKGMEWGNVTLWNDFFATKIDEATDQVIYPEAEAKLLYVACTRAQKKLDISMCSAVNRLIH